MTAARPLTFCKLRGWADDDHAAVLGVHAKSAGLLGREWPRPDVGDMGRSLTGPRRIAIDPAFAPLGAPIWVETAATAVGRRLMMAQDTGSAINGPQRGDEFCRSGDRAGAIAGEMKASGGLVTFLPRQSAAKVAA